jgi:hypothetical protein
VGCGLAQVICLHWTKAARGGEGARARGAVPVGFKVEAAELVGAEGVLCVDASQWGERNGFIEPVTVRRHRVLLAEGFSFGCVAVSTNPEGLLVRYQYDGTHGGAPNRWFLNWPGSGGAPGRALLARGGEWVRVCYNGRFSDIDTGNWWYQQVTVNVAWFAGEPDGRVFLDREPAQELRALAELW